MTFFTQDENKNLVESVAGIMAQRVAGATLPEIVREAAITAGKASVGKSLEERSRIMHRYFNTSSAEAQVEDRAFMPTNATVKDFNEVAVETLNQCEAAESAGSFEDVAKADGSPLSAEDRTRLNKRKTNEDAESAGSFEDVADDEGSPLSAEDRARLNKRKVKESLRDAAASFIENLANFGDKKKKFPADKDGDGKVNEEDSTGTDSELEDVDAKERQVSVKAKTVREIDTVPVSSTHSFVNESWTVLVNTDELSIGEQHLLAGKLVEQEEVTEASAGCPTNRQPFTVTVRGGSEFEAIENLVSALENIDSPLSATNILVAHRTPATE